MGKLRKFACEFDLLLPQAVLLIERGELDGFGLGLCDELAFDIEDFELGGRDELGGELFLETQALGEGKRLFEPDEQLAWADAAFVLETRFDCGIGQTPSGKLSTACFFHRQACSLQGGMMGSNSGGYVLQ